MRDDNVELYELVNLSYYIITFYSFNRPGETMNIQITSTVYKRRCQCVLLKRVFFSGTRELGEEQTTFLHYRNSCRGLCIMYMYIPTLGNTKVHIFEKSSDFHEHC